MIRKDLNELFKKVAKEVGFKEDKSYKSWMPKLGPNDYKCRIAHGFTDKGQATLTVGPKGFVNLESLQLAGDYFLAEKKNNPCIVLSSVWDIGNFDDRSWVLKERVDGTNPLAWFPSAIELEKRNICELYWNTAGVFSDIEEKQSKQSEFFFEDFFGKRLNKWLNSHSSCKSKLERQKHEVLRGIAENMSSYIFYESNISACIDLDMKLFFRNFGATDIVFKDEALYYLPSSDIDFFPEFYGAAYFVWNILMYSYDQGQEVVIDETEDWRETFKQNCPTLELRAKFDAGFYLLLFERVMATLLVDIPLRRSPFDVKNQKGYNVAIRRRNTEEVFVSVLKHLLRKIPSLVKNEPFQEDFVALYGIYKS